MGNRGVASSGQKSPASFLLNSVGADEFSQVYREQKGYVASVGREATVELFKSCHRMQARMATPVNRARRRGRKKDPDMVIHVCNLGTWEEMGGL